MKTIYLVMQTCYYKNGITTTGVVNAFKNKEEASKQVEKWMNLEKVLPEENVTICYSVRETTLY